MDKEEFSVRKFINPEGTNLPDKPDDETQQPMDDLDHSSLGVDEKSHNETPEAVDKIITLLKDPRFNFIYKGIKKRLIYILLIIFVFTSLGLFYAKTKTEYLYKATSHVIKRKKQEKISGTADDSAFQDYSLTTLLNTVKLRKNLEYVKQKLKLNIPNEILGSMIAIEKDRDSDILRISIVSKNPEQASDIANSLADAFVLNTVDIQRNLIEESHIYYQKQIDKTQKILQDKESELTEFNKKHGITELDSWMSALLKEMTEIDLLTETSRIESEGTDLRLKSLQTQIDKYPQQMVISSSIKDPLIEKKAELMFELNSLLAKYEPSNPKIAKINDQITQISDQIKKGEYSKNTEDTVGYNPTVKSLEAERALMESNREALNNKTEALKGVRQQIQDKLRNLTDIQKEYFELKRSASFTEELLKTLRNRLEDIKIVMEGQISDFKVLEYSASPKYPINPMKKKMTLIIFFMLGAFIAVFGAILLEFIKTDPYKIIKRIREI